MFAIFKKRFFGLDIADRSIEIVELTKTRGKMVRIVNLARIKLDFGIVDRGRIKKKEELIKAIKWVFSEIKMSRTGSRNLIFALPESQVYTHIFDLMIENKTVTETLESIREKMVLEEAQKNIPILKQNLFFNYKISNVAVLDQKRVKIEILLVATSSEVVSEWYKLFQELDIDLEFFDIETLATFRGLFFKPPKKPICIIDIGSATSNIAIFDKNNLRYSYLVNIAGNVLTNKIAEELKIENSEAEELKIKNGISGENKKVSSIIKNTFDPVISGVKESFIYFEDKTKKKISEIVLVGGSSQIKGLVKYFKDNIDLPVSIGEPALAPDKRKALVPILYLEAVGLALRGLYKKWNKGHPVIEIDKTRLNLKMQKPEETKEALSPEKKIDTELDSAVSQKFSVSETETVSGTQERDKTISPEALYKSKKKARKQKILFIIILIFGPLILGASIYFRKQEKAAKELELRPTIAQYTKTQSFDLDVPIAIKQEEYTNDRIRGRMIKDIIQWAGTYSEAVSNSRISAEKELQGTEVLWHNPITSDSADLSDKELSFPLDIDWIAYYNDDANRLLLNAVDKLNKDNIDYALNNIVKIGLKQSDNENIFFLVGRITISLNQLIKVEEIQQEEKELLKVEEIQQEEAIEEKELLKVEEIQQEEVIEEKPLEEKEEFVLIEERLNVRLGPGTNYERILIISPGNSYPLLQEQDKWYKIRVDDNIEGWIFSEYTSKLD